MYSNLRCSLYVVILIVVGCISYWNSDFHLMFHLDGDTEEYNRWIFCQSDDFMADKMREYTIGTYIDQELYLNVDSANNVVVGDNLEFVQIREYVDYSEIEFIDCGLLLDLDCGREKDYQNVHAFKKNDTKAQRWRIKWAEDGEAVFFMIGNESALSFDGSTENVYIRPFVGSDYQKWIIK